MRLLIIGDLHGSMPKIHTRRFDAVLAPGDFCGDDIRPYIKRWVKARTDLGADHSLPFEHFCPKDKQKELHKKSLEKGRKVLEKLNSLNKPVFLVPGNWDPTMHLDGMKNYGEKSAVEEKDWETLKEGLDNLIDIEFKKASWNGIDIIGHGSTSAPEPLEPRPKDMFKTRKEQSEYVQRVKFFTKIYKKLDLFMKKTSRPVILLTHNVPYNTKLDKVDAPGTYAHNKHYGSRLARRLIEENEPLLCVGGHIHEGYGKTRIKTTVCINAGFGGDVNTIVEIDPRRQKIVKIDFLGKNKI